MKCTQCGGYFDRYYNQISGKRTATVCRHPGRDTKDIPCLNCGNPVNRNGMCQSEYSRRKFCSSSCAASYNNKRRERTKGAKKKSCLNCGKEIPPSNKYCSPSCQHEYARKCFIEKWKSGENSGVIGNAFIDVSNHIKRYIFEKYGYECSKCGWNEINPFTGTLPLEIEHIDGDATNNNEDNLTLLCPNCHSLTRTYRGANKGRGTRNIKWLSRSGTTNTEK